MLRTVRVIGPVLLSLASAPAAVAQTTYHLHTEASSTGSRKQLKTAGPDVAGVAIQSANLKNTAIGEKLIKAFDTEAGVPGVAGVIPTGSTLTFRLWMKKTADAGTLFPRVKVHLNGASGAALCTATGTTAITTTLTTYTIACNTTATVTLAATSRFFLWAGADMTAGSTTTNFKAELDIEGTLNGEFDSQVAIPNAIPRPTITAPIVPSSAGVGQSVTINGTDFGATQGSSVLKFFNDKTAAPTSWSATSITTPVPAGATTGNVTVTVGTQLSPGVRFTVLATPAITTVSPTFGDVGTVVTITGTKFGAAQGTSTVSFAGTAATSFTSWSATKIRVQVPAAATTGPLVVTVNGVSSAGTTFTVSPIPLPSIASLTPSSGRVGDPLTVAGANFGATQGSSTVTFNGTLALPTNWSGTSIAVPVPNGATTGPVVVTVAGQASNGQVFTVVGSGTGLLEITSPASGTVVSPGQTLTVSLSSSDNSTFSSIAVIGEGVLGVTDVATSVPVQLTLTIPAQIECRRYSLTAFAVTTSGVEVFTSIDIAVERPDMPSAMTPRLRQIIFEAEGETAAIQLLGRFQDGSVLPVQESSNVTYESSDPAVATVDAIGVVTAIAEGEAEITATYGQPADGVTARIPVSVPPVRLALSPRELAFPDQAVGTTSGQQITVTNSSTGPLSITSLTATGDYTATENCAALSPLDPGASCTVTVTFGPTAAGFRPGAIGITTTFHLVPVVVTLTGTGVSH